MAHPLNVAVLGGDEPLAEALLAELEALDLPIGKVYPLSLGEAESTLSFNGDELFCEPAAGFDWADADLVFVLSRNPAVVPFADAALAARRPVLGLVDVFSEHAASCLVDSDGPGKLSAMAGLWLAPDAVTTMLARVLRPLVTALGVMRAEAFAALAVSSHGQDGINELKDQVGQLFAMSAIEPGAFPVQIAFNLVPQVGQVLDEGHTGMEHAVRQGLSQLLAAPSVPCGLTLSWAPVFYGHAIALHLVGGEGLSVANVRTRLLNAPGVVLMDEHVPGGCPTPATDAAESREVFVGRLRESDAPGAHGVQLWLVGDNVRLEAANLARIAQVLIEKHLE